MNRNHSRRTSCDGALRRGRRPRPLLGPSPWVLLARRVTLTADWGRARGGHTHERMAGRQLEGSRAGYPTTEPLSLQLLCCASILSTCWLRKG
jgi:hypothetical protein